MAVVLSDMARNDAQWTGVWPISRSLRLTAEGEVEENSNLISSIRPKSASVHRGRAGSFRTASVSVRVGSFWMIPVSIRLIHPKPVSRSALSLHCASVIFSRLKIFSNNCSSS